MHYVGYVGTGGDMYRLNPFLVLNGNMLSETMSANLTEIILILTDIYGISSNKNDDLYIRYTTTRETNFKYFLKRVVIYRQLCLLSFIKIPSLIIDLSA